MRRTKWIVMFAIAILLCSFYNVKPQSLANATSAATTQSPIIDPPAGAIIVSNNYPTIQAAIDNASAGDTVFVKEGTYYYYGGPIADAITINKPLSLIGEDSQKTILQEASSDYSTVGHHYLTGSVFKIMADNVSISGFTIDGAWYNAPYQVFGFNGPTFYQTGSGVEFGIIVGDYPNYYSGCKITGNNIINFCDEGISVRGGENNVVSGNKIGNTIGKVSGDGVDMQSSASVISNNNITGIGDTGIKVDSCVNVTIKQNNIVGNTFWLENGTANYFDYVGGLSLGWNSTCYVYDNNITDNVGFGIEFEGSNNSAVFNNNIMRNDFGISLPNFGFYPNSTIGGIGNKVYYNNIVNNTQNAFVQHSFQYNITVPNNGTDVVSWDNGKVGNYWSDYQTKYPNATEVDASGVGNTSYVIDENNTDHYPIIQQVDISTTAPTPTPAATPVPPASQISPVTFPIIIVVVVLAVLVISVLLCSRYRKVRMP
jgi:hypothetical protein